MGEWRAISHRENAMVRKQRYSGENRTPSLLGRDGAEGSFSLSGHIVSGELLRSLRAGDLSLLMSPPKNMVPTGSCSG